MQWLVIVNPTSQEAEIGRSWIEVSMGKMQDPILINKPDVVVHTCHPS
jgi:hypothetical protein